MSTGPCEKPTKLKKAVAKTIPKDLLKILCIKHLKIILLIRLVGLYGYHVQEHIQKEHDRRASSLTKAL